MQSLLTVIAWLLALGSVVFAWFVQMANAMKTTAPPLSGRDAMIAITPALVCSCVLLWLLLMAHHSGNFKRTLAWNAVPLSCVALAFLMVAAGWLSDRPNARRAATQYARAREEKQNAERWQRSGSISSYNLHVEHGVQVAAIEKDGLTRPGGEWRISCKADGVARNISVRTIAMEREAIDLEHHARQVLQQLKERLDNGWRPKDDGSEVVELSISR